MDRTEALSQRAALEEQYGGYLERLEAASEPGEQSRLLLELDTVVGERLALEQDHAEEFGIVDAAAVQAA